MKFAFTRLIASWFGLAAIVSIALAAGWYISLVKSTESVRWVEHTHKVLYRLRMVAALMDEIVVGVRGYDLTGVDRFLEPYHRALPAIDAELTAIRNLTADNFSQQKRLTDLETLVAERLNRIKVTLEERGRGETDAFARLYLGEFGEKLRQRTRVAINEMEAEEERLLVLRVQAATSSRYWSVAFVAGWDGREHRNHGLRLSGPSAVRSASGARRSRHYARAKSASRGSSTRPLWV